MTPPGEPRSRSGTARRPRRRQNVRPTSALVRTGLFNHLGDVVSGAHVLDLFAGTGGLGLDALRRGAARAVFVEHNARLVSALRTRLAEEALAEQAEVWQRDVAAAIWELGRTRRRFDLILLDPPYGEGWIPRSLRLIQETGILRPDGIVVAEGHWRDEPEGQGEWVSTHQARYGETVLWYFAARKEDTST